MAETDRKDGPTRRFFRFLYSRERRYENAKKVARINGWLLVISSPVLFLVARGRGVEEYGWFWGVILGFLMGTAWLVVGLFLIWQSRRMKPPNWLRLKRFRKEDDS